MLVKEYSQKHFPSDGTVQVYKRTKAQVEQYINDLKEIGTFRASQMIAHIIHLGHLPHVAIVQENEVDIEDAAGIRAIYIEDLKLKAIEALKDMKGGAEFTGLIWLNEEDYRLRDRRDREEFDHELLTEQYLESLVNIGGAGAGSTVSNVTERLYHKNNPNYQKSGDPYWKKILTAAKKIDSPEALKCVQMLSQRFFDADGFDHFMEIYQKVESGTFENITEQDLFKHLHSLQKSIVSVVQEQANKDIDQLSNYFNKSGLGEQLDTPVFKTLAASYRARTSDFTIKMQKIAALVNELR